MMLTPIYPDYSMRLNPLSHWYMQDELVDHVVSGDQDARAFLDAFADLNRRWLAHHLDVSIVEQLHGLQGTVRPE